MSEYDTTEDATRAVVPAAALGPTGFEPASVPELHQVARLAVAGGYAPRGTTIEGAMLAIAKGRECGLPALYSLQNIAVINGKPSIYGDAMLALAQQSGQLAYFREETDGEGDDRAAACTVQRAAMEKQTATFSVRDAKTAALWGKPGPWSHYPDRMLAMRARSFALRNAFADVLAGLIAVEEAQDYPTPTVDVGQPKTLPAPLRQEPDAQAAAEAKPPVAKEAPVGRPKPLPAPRTRKERSSPAQERGKALLAAAKKEPGYEAATDEEWEMWCNLGGALSEKQRGNVQFVLKTWPTRATPRPQMLQAIAKAKSLLGPERAKEIIGDSEAT